MEKVTRSIEEVWNAQFHHNLELRTISYLEGEEIGAEIVTYIVFVF